MRKIPIWLIVILALIIGAFVLNEQPKQNEEPKQAEENTNLPPALDFTLKDLEGNTVSLADYKGKNVYLNFWATWCGPCNIEMPDLEKFHQAYKDKDWVVIAVDAGEEQAKVQDFITAHNYSFLVLLDSKGSASKAYKVSSIPYSFFINKKGEIVSQKKGVMSFSQMEAYASKL